MREILFKAKKWDSKEWVEGNLITLDADSGYYFISEPYTGASTLPVRDLIYNHTHLIDAKTICQFTGLIDKNGNKIFENDIVKYHFGEDAAVIRYGKYQNCFDSTKACHVGFFVDWQDCKRKDLGYWVEMIDCNVVGNVFDNAELLKE